MRKPAKQIGVGCADIGELEVKYVNDALRKKRLSYGYYLKRFERKFARLHDQKFSVFVNSGASALHLSLQALKELNNWKDDDEIIVPALTFVASPNVVLHNRLQPVFVDVDPTHFDINYRLIESKITPRTKAIMPVNILGQPAQIDKVLQIAKRHKLKVIEDSCETMLVKYQNKPVGSQSDVTCYSTYIAHLLVTGVGGLATTNDQELAIKIRSLANHGRDGIYISIDDDKTKSKGKLREVMKKRFNFIDIGHSFRATELEGAIGLAQLSRWEKIIRTHQKNAAYLTERLSPLSNFLQLPSKRAEAEHGFMVYPLIVRSPKVKRNDLTFFLETKNIETRFLLPLLNQPIYKKLFGENFEKQFPVAQYLSSNGFYLGCHQQLTKDDLNYIVESIFSFFRKNKMI